MNKFYTHSSRLMPYLHPFFIGGIGVATFHLLNIPLPWLLGPIFACLTAALIGVKMLPINPLNDGMRTILGVAVGATLTPTVVAMLPQMWVTLIFVPLMVIAIGLVGVPYFTKIWKYDFATAYYSAMPGGLQDMLVFGEEAGGNVRTLSLIHATRVLVIVVILPFLLTFIWQADLTKPPGLPAKNVSWDQLFFMVFSAIIGWRLAKMLGMFGASILGPLFVAMALALLGVLNQRPPAEAIWAAQFFIGITVGAKYVGITIQEIKRDLVAALGFCLILIALTLIVVELIIWSDLANGMEALLAFAPGGQAELTVLAIIVGADVAFVAVHHVFRIFLVILGAPIIKKFSRPKPQG